MKQWTLRAFVKLVVKNGYSYKHCRGSHYIYVNVTGRHISIPRSLEAPIANRLIKEYNLKND